MLCLLCKRQADLISLIRFHHNGEYAVTSKCVGRGLNLLVALACQGQTILEALMGTGLLETALGPIRTFARALDPQPTVSPPALGADESSDDTTPNGRHQGSAVNNNQHDRQQRRQQQQQMSQHSDLDQEALQSHHRATRLHAVHHAATESYQQHQQPHTVVFPQSPPQSQPESEFEGKQDGEVVQQQQQQQPFRAMRDVQEVRVEGTGQWVQQQVPEAEALEEAAGSEAEAAGEETQQPVTDAIADAALRVLEVNHDAELSGLYFSLWLCDRQIPAVRSEGSK